MPGTDASNLAKTLVRLAWELLRAPTVCDTLKAVALRNGNDIDHFILLENA